MLSKSTVNLAWCSDANYLEYVATSIISVLMNNLTHNIACYVFVYDVSQEDIAKLKSTSATITVIEIEKSEIEKYDSNLALKHLNRSIYIRLCVPRLLQDKVENIIYLDADTLCLDDISAIQQVDISNVICAVSHDSLTPHESKQAKRLGLNSKHYFNSGFMYINITQWMKCDIENKANLFILKHNSALPYPDQDALNAVMDGNVKFIDNRWNYLYNWYSEEQRETYFYHAETTPRILHFTGSRKPWYHEHSGLSQQLYLFYQHFTPWRNTPLRSYAARMRPTDFRVYSRQAARKKHYLTSVIWYLKYLRSKLK